MKYQHITQDEMDDHIAEAMRGRELEHFYRSVNIANYEEMLKTIEPGERRDYIEKLLGEEKEYITHEDQIHAALTKQIEDPTRLRAAQVRIAAKVIKQKP